MEKTAATTRSAMIHGGGGGCGAACGYGSVGGRGRAVSAVEEAVFVGW